MKTSLKHYIKKNKTKNQDLAVSTHLEMMKLKRGRICLSPYLNVLLSIKEFMGDNCKNYVEIGSLWGGSVCCLLKLNNTNTTYTCIDLFTGYYGIEIDINKIKNHDYKKPERCSPQTVHKHLLWESDNVGNVVINKNNHKSFVNDTIKMYNLNKNKINLIQGSSYDDSTLKKFNELVNEIDLLFIDGDHSTEGVQKDFMKYNKFMNKNGIIIFDNYGDPNWPGVKNGVDNINFEKYNFEIVGEFGHSLIVLKI